MQPTKFSAWLNTKEAAMKFIATLNGKKIKTFSAVRTLGAGSLCRRFDEFCKARGFDTRIDTAKSFGFTGWANTAGDMVILERTGDADFSARN